MFKHYLRLGIGLGGAAAAALVMVALFLWGPTVKVASAAQVLADGIKAVAGISSVHIKAELRTPPGGDNLVTIDLEGVMTPVELWKRYGEGNRGWRIEGANRVTTYDGKETVHYIRPINTAIKWPRERAEWFGEVMDIDRMLASQVQEGQRAGVTMKSAEETVGGKKALVVTVDSPAQGDFSQSDWLKNKSISTSDTRRVFRFDAESKRLRGLEIHVKPTNGKDVVVFRTTAIEYDAPVADELLTLKLPADVQWYGQPSANAPGAEMAPEAFARKFFEDLSKGDAAATKDALGMALPAQATEAFKGIEVVSLGKPFKSGRYPGSFVPYEIKFRDGSTKKMNLAVRNDTPGKKWMVDGGF